jgi:predicted metal-dependent hydrolase
MKYLSAYPETLQSEAQALLEQGRLGELLQRKYPGAHCIRTDRALFDHVQALKARYLRSAEPLSKVCFDSKLHVIHHALGTHTAISRVQGSQLKAKREIRIATVFKEVPLDFLNMIAVHELAHIRHKAHDKAFYQLCHHMLPDYHQVELDVRLYLTLLEASGPLNWD